MSMYSKVFELIMKISVERYQSLMITDVSDSAK